MPRHPRTLTALQRYGCLIIIGVGPLRALHAQNLVTNPGFESGSTGWESSGISISTALPHSGAACALVNVSAYGSGVAQVMTGVVQPAQEYNFSAWLRTASGVVGPIALRFAYSDSVGGGVLSLTNRSIGSTWALLSADFSFHPTGAVTFVSIRIDNISGAGFPLFIDDVTVRNITPALTINSTNNGVRLSWPLGTGGYSLEASTNLPPTSNWTAITNVTQTNSGLVAVTLPATNSHRFFRLNRL